MKHLPKTLAAAALATLACAAPAAAADQPSQACRLAGDAVFPGEPGITHGGCVSLGASGELRGAGYAAQCRNLAEAFGGYPIVFLGDEHIIGPDTPVARNHGECVNVLRALHTSFGG